MPNNADTISNSDQPERDGAAARAEQRASNTQGGDHIRTGDITNSLVAIGCDAPDKLDKLI